MRRLLGILLSISLAFAFPTGAASATETALETANFEVSSSPDSGDFDVVVYRSKSGQHAVLRIKFPQLGDKIQLMRVDSKGRMRQVFAYTLTEDQLDAQGNYLNLTDGHFVRVFTMSSSKMTYQVLVNGEEYLEPKTLTKNKKPLVKVNAVNIKTPADSITGDGSFEFSLNDPQEGAALNGFCLSVDDQPLGGQLLKSIGIDSSPLILDQSGCFTKEDPIDFASRVTAILNTKAIGDGAHRIKAVAAITNSAGKPVTAEAAANFITDNMSLNATAPQPTFSGVYSAGNVLTVLPGNWGTGTTFTYKWFSNDLLIRGATSDKYLLSYADVGKVLRVEVTGKRSDVDKATRVLETTTPITEQQVGAISQGFIGQSSAAFNVTEQSRVYNSVTRQYENKEVNNYNVSISFPDTVICKQAYSYSSASCSFSASATWGGLFDSFESFSETVRLVRVSDRTQIDSEYMYLSTSTSSDTLEFFFYASSLSNNPALNQYRIEISDAGYNQTLTPLGSGIVTFIKGPNTSVSNLSYQVTDKAVTQTQRSVVTSGGTSQNPNWTLWQFASPTKVKVMQSCAILPIYIAPQSLLNGSLSDPTTQRSADATISIFSANGQLREKVIINGSRGDWNNLVSGNRVNIKVCDLIFQKGKKENLRIQFDLRYDAYNFEATSSSSSSIEMLGNMKFTKINCYQGEEGMTINAYKPTCPEGWTLTKAKVKNGKVEMKTLNCLAGRDLQVIRAPEPVCPEGYEVTTLRVKDGKLVPWSIVCRKGFDKKTIRGVFPTCPAGYKRS